MSKPAAILAVLRMCNIVVQVTQTKKKYFFVNNFEIKQKKIYRYDKL